MQYARLCNTCIDIFLDEQAVFYDEEQYLRLLNNEEPGAVDRAGDYQRSCIKTHHNEVTRVAVEAAAGCYICDSVFRHFFPERTPTNFLEHPVIIRGDIMPHIFMGTGTHYRLRAPDRTFKDRLPKSPTRGKEKPTVEIEIGLNSPISQDSQIPEYKSLAMILARDEAMCDLMRMIYPAPSLDIFDVKGTWKIVMQWLYNCVQSHDCCRGERRDPGWNPTRLLDVEASDLSSRLAALDITSAQAVPGVEGLRLVDTHDFTSAADYLTLSHRWQSTPRLLLTRQNYDELHTSIDESTLPTMFQQAIQIARKLKVRYLWIDQLCIIQKDDEDWAKESAQMGRIYSNGWLNLCATAGSSKLIPERNPRLIMPCIITPHWDRKEDRDGYLLTDFRWWDERVYRSALNRRGWVIQERYLSRRVLHFGFDQLLWECNDVEASETFPHRLPYATLANKHTGMKSNRLSNGHLELPWATPEKANGQSHEALHQHWCRLLETYGRAEMTYQKDRFPAVLMMADQFASRLQDEFIAGLWRRTLPSDLLWHVEKTRRTNWPSNNLHGETHATAFDNLLLSPPDKALEAACRTDKYYAPSWSWLSVLGDIEPGSYVLDNTPESMIDIVKGSVIFHTPDAPLSGIRDASLQLRGRLYPVTITKGERIHNPSSLHIARLEQPDIQLWGPSLEFDVPQPYAKLEGMCFLSVACVRHERPAAASDGVGSSFLEVKGLLLVPVDLVEQTFRRVGIATFYNSDAEYFSAAEDSHALEAAARTVSREAVVKKKGNFESMLKGWATKNTKQRHSEAKSDQALMPIASASNVGAEKYPAICDFCIV